MRGLTIAVAVAALACGGVVAAIELASDHHSSSVVWAVFAPAVGWSCVGTGLYAWRQRSASRVGPLMVLLGFAWFLYTLDASDSPFVYTFARSGSSRTKIRLCGHSSQPS